MIGAHRFADLLPMMTDEQFAVLKANIEEQGLREPIILLGGKILDGRNRYRAMLEIDPKITPKNAPKLFAKFKGDEGEALDLVISKNLARRHLTDAQRAMVAASIAENGPTIAAAASAMRVRPDLVKKAKALQVRDPDRAEAVKRGELKIGNKFKCVSASLDDDEYALCAATATACDMTLNGWVKFVLLAAAESIREEQAA